MALPVEFQKLRAEEVLASFAHGLALSPTREGAWTVHDLLLVAGCAFSLVYNQGPPKLRGEGGDKLPAEHQEAAWDRHQTELASAIEWHANLAGKLLDGGDYDRRFEAIVRAIVSAEMDRRVVYPFEGFKKVEAENKG